MPASAPTRRDRRRAATHAEIGDRAMAQVARGGPIALSLTAIARDMGMSGPAIYRYVASRDALLGRLVGEVFAALADALEQAVADASDRRFEALAAAYRAWALSHRREYLLVTTRVSGADERASMLLESSRAMGLLVATLREVAPPEASASDEPPVWLRTLGVVAWQRLHGHLTLELEGLHEAMGLDADAVFAGEVDAFVSEARAPRPR